MGAGTLVRSQGAGPHTAAAILPRAAAALACAAATLVCAPAPAGAADPRSAAFDARRASPAQATATALANGARERLRRDLGALGTVTTDAATGRIRAVAKLDGSLTGPSRADAADVALGYVARRRAAFGLGAADVGALRLVRRTAAGGLVQLTWEQRDDGLPSVDTQLEATVATDGRLLTVTGPAAPGLDAPADRTPAVSAERAYAATLRSGRAGGAVPAVTGAAAGRERLTRFAGGGHASLVLYRGATGTRLAWRVLAPVSSTAIYDAVVDARTGRTVRRANRVDFAEALVFDADPERDGGAQRTERLDPWLTAGDRLEGPYAHAFTDVDDVVPYASPTSRVINLTPSPGSEVAPVEGNWRFPLVPAGVGLNCTEAAPCTWSPAGPDFGWEDDRAQSATQLFSYVNRFHDHLAQDPDIAFDAASGAFEGAALGDPNGAIDLAAGDHVLAQALDGANTGDRRPDVSHRNNANFATLPDGFPGLMQMYLWEPEANGPWGAYDGANDASLVYHEYTHGMTNRLVTDAQGWGALDTAQAGALGEALSDFYAADYLADPDVGEEVDEAGAGDVRIGAYVEQDDPGALRAQALDCAPADTEADACGAGSTTQAGAGGFTYADFGRIADGAEVHRDGEIWAQTLWSARAALIAAHGEAEGIARARRYVTQGLRLAPPEPSFLDLRNAMLVASDEDDALLWRVFAERGMGYFATTEGSADTHPVADATDPAALPADTGTLSGSVVDEDGAPVSGVRVGLGGHDTELGAAPGGAAVATTGADGLYAIAGVRATGPGQAYPLLRATRTAFVPAVVTGLAVAPGDNARTLTVRRDWSSALGGAAVARFTGPNFTPSGCGPGGLIDDDRGVVWGSDNPSHPRARSPEPPELVVDLGAAVDVGSVAIDPSAGCGDDASAALGRYEVTTAASADGPWEALAEGGFTAADNGRMNEVFAGRSAQRRYVRLRLLAPQDASPGRSGNRFIDVAELQVLRAPAQP